MTESRPYTILDLLTDQSESTQRQLLASVEKKCNGETKSNTTVLSSALAESGPLSSYRTVVSQSVVDGIFKTKCRLDEAGTTDFLVVTTRIMKKYWEAVCFLMFSHVHNWSVLGVDVRDQSTIIVPPDLTQVETSIKNYLMSLDGSGKVEIIRSRIIPCDMFNAGFHTRQGGISQLPPLASMNMLHTIRKPDPLIVIAENCRRLAVAADFDLDLLNVARTEHGKKVWVMGRDPEPPLKYDGVITDVPGVVVAAPGADCCVILLADTRTGACGAVHAGWMGTVAMAARETLRAMVDNYGTDPRHVHAAIGPSVGGQCFDMPISDAQVITDLDPSLTWPSERKEGWVHTNLPGANAVILQNEGVPKENIDLTTALCTACNKNMFFSHRRDSIPFGNQLGFISCRKR